MIPAIRRSAALLLAPLLLLACDGPSTGRLSLRLTDAPGDLESAVVTISRIELVGSGGTIVLRDTPVTTDLLTLANDTAGLVTDAVVPTGTYSQLRFVITGGYVEVPQVGGGTLVYASSPGYAGLREGTRVSGDLRMPSFGESGLKVTLPGGGVEVGTGSHVLLVDFDVAQSFGHETGGADAWVMHPVMHAVELELSGTVEVTLRLGNAVTLPAPATLAQLSAVLTNADGSAEVLPLGDLGGGTFGATFRYLIPGTYTLAFTAPGLTAIATNPPVPATVAVASGQPTVASFVLTSAY